MMTRQFQEPIRGKPVSSPGLQHKAKSEATVRPIGLHFHETTTHYIVIPATGAIRLIWDKDAAPQHASDGDFMSLCLAAFRLHAQSPEVSHLRAEYRTIDVWDQCARWCLLEGMIRAHMVRVYASIEEARKVGTSLLEPVREGGMSPSKKPCASEKPAEEETAA